MNEPRLDRERWLRIKHLFAEVASLPSAERVRFLAVACPDDEPMRREIDALVASCDEAGDFFERRTPVLAALAGVSVVLPAAIVRLAAGQRLGPYEILDLIGAGGMGEVYRARDTRLHRDVALKVLPPALVGDRDRRERFVQEARAASALEHPHIAVIHEIGEAGGVTFIAMELLRGETLSGVLARGPLPPVRAVELAVQIAEGLARAHEKGIVHRDLKPANVMLTEDGHLKIIDFGLAKLVESLSGDDGVVQNRTDPGMVLGTASYMSPEQARGVRVDQRSDVFSLGIVLYEMLTGRPPFRGRTYVDTMHAILHDPAPPLPPSIGPATADLERILEKCLAKEPDDRYQGTRDLVVDLRAARRRIESAQMRAVGTREALTWRSLSRRTTVSMAVAALLVAIAAAIAAARFLAGSPAVSNSPPLHVVPFTSSAGSVRMPAFSPDGEKIAFAWTGPLAAGNWDIYVKMIGSGPPLRLTADKGEDNAPAWSPDGRQIAFLRANGKEKSVSIYVIGALGGPERKLADVTFGRYFNLQWTGDGKSIVFADKTSPQVPYGSLESSALFLLSVDTLQKRQLTFPQRLETDHRFAVAPDGTTLAFLRHGYRSGVGIFTMPISGGQPKEIYTEHSWAGRVVWSADGRSLIFTSTREGGDKLWRLPAAGGEPQSIPIAEESAYSPTVAAHGDRLAYVREYFDTDLVRLEISRAGRAASTPKPVAASARLETGPALSADGRKLAFFSEQSGRRELWISNADGSSPAQMTDFFAWDTLPPTWSPDGNHLAFYSGQGPGDTGAGLFVLDVETRQVRRLPCDSNFNMPQWSRDGRWIFGSTGNTGTRQIAKIPADGGPAIPITQHGGMMPRESPDGRSLYYVKETGGLWHVPAGGGEESRVVADFPLSSWSNWAVVDGGIYYIAQEAPLTTELAFYDFATRKRRHIAAIAGDMPPFQGGLAVSPDRASIIYTQVSRSSSDIMLVENFR